MNPFVPLVVLWFTFVIYILVVWSRQLNKDLERLKKEDDRRA